MHASFEAAAGRQPKAKAQRNVIVLNSGGSGLRGSGFLTINGQQRRLDSPAGRTTFSWAKNASTERDARSK